MKRWRWLAACIAAGSLAGTAGAQDGQGGTDLFKSLDKNGDGKLEASEVSEEQARFFERMVRVGDKDGDGVLTAEEFQAGTKDQTEPTSPPPGRGRGDFSPGQFFERMDRNKDGKLTRDELPEQARERMGRLFDRLGKDALTREDLAEGFRQMVGERRPDANRGEFLKRLDRDGNGKISREELPEQLRERMGRIFDQAGQDELPLDRLMTALEQAGPREGDRPRPEGDRPRPDGERRPEGDRPRAEGERRPDGDRPFGERRPDGDRPPMMGRGPAFVRLLDKNEDGALSREELARAAEIFAELDRNADGKLDMPELMGFPGGPRDGDRPGMDRRPEGDRPRPEGDRPRGEGDRPRPEGDRPRPEGDRPRGEGRPEVGGFFERFDTNKDGQISKEEAPERMRENFGRMDADGNGQITVEEMRAAFAGREGGPRPEGARPRPDGDRPAPESDRPRRPE